MVNETMYDELDRYVSGRMNAEERLAFETTLSNDPSLNEELNWLQSTMMVMQTNGRLVLKQHIGAAIASVPKGELEKYSPSKNGKSFLKKWWWAISVAVIAVAAAVSAVYYVTHKHDVHDERDSEGNAPSETTIVPQMNMDSLMQLKIADSCAAIDSMMQTMEMKEDLPREETVRVSKERKAPEVYYQIDERGKIDSIIKGANK